MSDTRKSMGTFVALLLGQTVSMLGTLVAGFSIGVWLYERTHSVTLYAAATMVTLLPALFVGPFAGVLADRWSRRGAIIIGQVGGAVCSLVLLTLFHFHHLNTVALLTTACAGAVFSTLEAPALSATIVLLVPSEHLGRANGFGQGGAALTQLGAPLLAGMLLPLVGLGNVLWFDCGTFAFALIVLALVKIPRPVRAPGEASAPTRFRDELLLGWRYVRKQPGLMALLVLFMGLCFNAGVIDTLITPLVLGFGDMRTLSRVYAMGGVGALSGSVLMMIWGGPRRALHGVLGFVLVEGLLLCLGGARPFALLISGGAFGVLFAHQVVAGCSGIIWMRRVPVEVQGREAAVRMAVGAIATEVAMAIAGPLSDHVFEPAMAVGGRLAPTAGRLLGVGSGRGVALFMMMMGVLTITAAFVAAAYRPLRRVEDEIVPASAALENVG